MTAPSTLSFGESNETRATVAAREDRAKWFFWGSVPVAIGIALLTKRPLVGAAVMAPSLAYGAYAKSHDDMLTKEFDAADAAERMPFKTTTAPAGHLSAPTGRPAYDPRRHGIRQPT